MGGADYADFLVRLAVDVTAIALLVGAVYDRRHHRRDLAVAYVGLNLALLLVITVLFSLPSTDVGIGVGLGLFAVLSIIRLRSEETTYVEVAYFFSALALAVINGVAGVPLGFAIMLSAILVVGMAVIDSPLLAGRVQRQTVLLDGVFVAGDGLRAHLEERLGAQVLAVAVSETDCLRETTRVTVRYVPRPGAAAAPPAAHLNGTAPRTPGEDAGRGVPPDR
jgi:hypothetical protein